MIQTPGSRVISPIVVSTPLAAAVCTMLLEIIFPTLPNLLFIELRRSEEKNENIQMVGMDVIFAAYAADHQYINCL